VRHRSDGLLIAPESGISGLSQGLEMLMDGDKLRQDLGLCAMDVRERFSLARVSGLWGDVMGIGS
jgi:hypothetical protein